MEQSSAECKVTNNWLTLGDYILEVCFFLFFLLVFIIVVAVVVVIVIIWGTLYMY